MQSRGRSAGRSMASARKKKADITSVMSANRLVSAEKEEGAAKHAALGVLDFFVQ